MQTSPSPTSSARLARSLVHAFGPERSAQIAADIVALFDERAISQFAMALPVNAYASLSVLMSGDEDEPSIYHEVGGEG